MSKAKCLNCGDVIESKHRHDWQCCSCFPKYASNGGHGIYIDGGDEYLRMGGNFDDFEGVLEKTYSYGGIDE